jgi:membrane associated rhomboid family serine protease
MHELVPMCLKFSDGLWKQVEDGTHMVQIDACPTCNGAWFDAGELDLLAGGEANIESAFEEGDRDSRRTCPRGCGLMREHCLPRKQLRTPLDRCPECLGLWLDGQERYKLAKSTTKEGQQKATKRWARRGAIWVAQLLTQLPVEVENPARGTPWVVFSLIAILAITYGFQMLGFIDLADCQPGFGGEPVGEVCLAPVAGPFRDQWDRMGFGSLGQGQGYTVLTHMFLHGGIGHLLGNLYFLYTFGDNVEHLFGHKRFLAFFVLAGLMGGLLELALTRSTMTPIVGASGGIAGIMAAYMLCFPKNKLFQVILFVQVKLPAWVYLFFWVGFQAVMGVFQRGDVHTAWWAHVGGFVFGLALTPLIKAWRRREVAAAVKVPAAT